MMPAKTNAMSFFIVWLPFFIHPGLDGILYVFRAMVRKLNVNECRRRVVEISRRWY
jgi:hypothetical protein